MTPKSQRACVGTLFGADLAPRVSESLGCYFRIVACVPLKKGAELASGNEALKIILERSYASNGERKPDREKTECSKWLHDRP